MGDVEAVVLAAGLSRRSKRYKMALPLGDRSVIERSIDGMYDSVSRIIVVVGWQAEVVRRLLAPYDKVECVFNKEFRKGMFSSVRAGVACVSAQRFFLQPGDIPLVREDVYAQLLQSEGDVIIPTYERHKGHPVLIDSCLVPEILSAPANVTLRDVLVHHKGILIEVDDQAILWDLDTEDDYQHLLQRERCRHG